MEWSTLYGKDREPTLDEISCFINNSLWEKLNIELQNIYQTQPKLSYSTCSGQPGWNIKYSKSARSLCTLYPMEGYFIALVVIGNKEMPEMELTLPTFSEYVQELYRRIPFACGGKWLMSSITNEEVLNDVIQLIKNRVRPKRPVI
jgi:hypothetical protein